MDTVELINMTSKWRKIHKAIEDEELLRAAELLGMDKELINSMSYDEWVDAMSVRHADFCKEFMEAFGIKIGSGNVDI